MTTVLLLCTSWLYGDQCKVTNKRYDLGMYGSKYCWLPSCNWQADSTLNAKIYILKPKLLPSFRDLFTYNTPFLFYQDSAPCHTAKICNQHQSQPWPGNSPNLNLIEHLWHHLKSLVRMRSLSNKVQLIEAIIAFWHYVMTKAELQTLKHLLAQWGVAVMQFSRIKATLLSTDNTLKP